MTRITNQRKKQTRRGFTLIELVGVMVILIGLAGVVVPKIPDLLARLHFSSSATSGGEAAALVQLYNEVNNLQPEGWDNIIETVGASTNLFNKLPDDGTDLVGNQLATLTLTATQADVLANAGIVNVYKMDDTTTSPTFDPYATGLGSPQALASGEIIVEITDTTALEEELYVKDSSIDTYVIFGIGSRTDIVGDLMMEAPVNFDHTAGNSPKDKYSRFGVVYKIADTATSTDAAQFVGIVAIEGTGIKSVQSQIQAYWDEL